MHSATSTGFPLLAGLIFALVALFIVGLMLLWISSRGTTTRKIADRLRALETEAQPGRETARQDPSGSSAGAHATQRALKFPDTRAIERRLRQAGMDWSVLRLLMISLLTGLLAGAVVSLLLRQSVEISVAVGIFAIGLPWGYISQQRTRRLTRLGQQLPDMLGYLARYLRTGNALPFGLQMISENMPDPIAGEFRILHEEISFGLPLYQALANLSIRVPNADLRFFVTAMTINSETGGNIIEILDNLGRLIRERQKLQAKVRVLASEGVLSAWILVAMPFVLGAALFALAPQFMSGLWTDPIGLPLVQGASVLMVIGIVVLRKLVRIRV